MALLAVSRGQWFVGDDWDFIVHLACLRQDRPPPRLAETTELAVAPVGDDCFLVTPRSSEAWLVLELRGPASVATTAPDGTLEVRYWDDTGTTAALSLPLRMPGGPTFLNVNLVDGAIVVRPHGEVTFCGLELRTEGPAGVT